MTIKLKDEGYEAFFSIDELSFLHQAFNEMCNGVRLRDLSRIGKLDDAEKQMEHLAAIYEDAVRSTDSKTRISLDFERATLYSNVIAIVCEEIEDWEFHTRTGGTRPQAIEMQKQLQKVISH